MVLGPAEKRAQEYLRNRCNIDAEIAAIRKFIAADYKKQVHRSKIIQHDITQLPEYKAFIQAEEKHIEKLQAERNWALFLIGQIRNERYRTVLEHIYIDGMTAEAAADIMHYSTTHFSRLKAKALHAAAAILEQMEA